MSPHQFQHYVIVMQAPVVLLLVIFTRQAKTAFLQEHFRLVSVGWFANFAYLVASHAGSDQITAIPWRTFAALFGDAVMSGCFLIAARNYFKEAGGLSHLARLPRTVIVGITAIAYASAALGTVRQSPGATNVLYDVPAVVVATFAIFALAWQLDDTIDRRQLRKAPARWIAILGLSLYAFIQPLALFIRDSGWIRVVGFSIGLLAKSLLLIGLVGVFVLSAEASVRAEGAKQRLTALVRTVGRITHELGTPVRHLDVQLTSLHRTVPSHGEFAQQVARIENTVRRIEAVVEATITMLPNPQRLLDITMLADDPRAAMPEPDQVIVNVNTLVQLALMAVKETRHERVTVRTSFSANCCVRTVPFELTQVLINVLRNAYDAVPEGERGTVRVSTHNADAHVLITTTDDGHGIPADLQQMVLHEGYTTRRGAGRGYGLSIASSLIQKNGGALRVRSPVLPAATTRPGTEIEITLERVPCVSKKEG